MPTATQIAANDANRLKYVALTFCGVDANNYEDQPIPRAFAAAGILGFNSEFILLSEQDIEDLREPAATDGTHGERKLSMVEYRRLKIVLAYFHDRSRIKGGIVDMSTVSKTAFTNFATGIYRPDQPIIPYGIPKPNQDDEAVNNWRKHIRPNEKAFKEFKDEFKWSKVKEDIKITLAAQNLPHLIDESYVPTNSNLDKAQNEWFYKVLNDVMTAPRAKTIVIKHSVDKDCRAIWKECCEAFDNSMTTQYYVQKLSSYLTSTRFVNINWKGKVADFVLHWKETARKYDEAALEPYTPAQKVQFLNACVAGFEPLAGVLNIRNTAASAAGITTRIGFDEYVEALLVQAETYDGGNTSSRNPRVSRQVNMTELIFDDDDTPEPVSHYDASVHDMDTPVDLLMANVNEQGNRYGPRKVLMNKQTWVSLSKDDQEKWDTMSDDGKSKILEYVKDRNNKLTGQGSSNYNSGVRFGNNNGYRGNNNNASRSINVHEQPETEEKATDTQLIVNTHELYSDDLLDMQEPPVESAPQPEVGDLLHMACHKTKTPMSANIAMLMSSKSKISKDKGHTGNSKPQIEVKSHDFMPRSKNTIYEVNMHAFDDDFDDAELLDEHLSDESEQEQGELFIASSRSNDAHEESIRIIDSNDTDPDHGVLLDEHLSESDGDGEGETLLADGIASLARLGINESVDDSGYGTELDPSPTKLKSDFLRDYDPFASIVQEEMTSISLETDALSPPMNPPFGHVRKPTSRLKDRVKDKADGTGHYLEDDPRSTRVPKRVEQVVDSVVDRAHVDPELHFATEPPSTPTVDESWSTVVAKAKRVKPAPKPQGKKGSKLTALTTTPKNRTNKHKRSPGFCAQVLSPIYKAQSASSSSDSGGSNTSSPKEERVTRSTKTSADNLIDETKNSRGTDQQDFHRAKVE